MGKLLKGADAFFDPAAQLFGGGKEGKISAALDPGNLRDQITGKSEKEAGKKKAAAATDAADLIRIQSDAAREEIFRLFPQANQELRGGFQGALDVFGQSLPAQTQAFQQGNAAAQQQLISGLPLFQNAILGGNVDFSQLQPSQQQTPDLSFFQQQLPNFAPVAGVDPATTGPTIPNAFAPGTQFQGPTQAQPNPLTGQFDFQPQAPRNLFALGGF